MRTTWTALSGLRARGEQRLSMTLPLGFNGQQQNPVQDIYRGGDFEIHPNDPTRFTEYQPLTNALGYPAAFSSSNSNLHGSRRPSLAVTQRFCPRLTTVLKPWSPYYKETLLDAALRDPVSYSVLEGNLSATDDIGVDPSTLHVNAEAIFDSGRDEMLLLSLLELLPRPIADQRDHLRHEPLSPLFVAAPFVATEVLSQNANTANIKTQSPQSFP